MRTDMFLSECQTVPTLVRSVAGVQSRRVPVPPLADCSSCQSFRPYISAIPYLSCLQNYEEPFIYPNFTGKRIAYAASFGVDNWEFSDEQTLICKELIKKFDAISVRESNGVSLCKEHFNVSAIHLLDPTLLVQRQDYFDLCKKVKPSNSFVAVYCLDMTDDKRKIIKDLALKKNLPIRLFGANKDAKLSIEQWLAMFRDAESVITDSFHGTIFSIIFQKPFYSIVNEGRGTSRFYSLLSSLGLAERMQSDFFDKGINWERVEKELSIFQKKSLDFLIYSLSK